MNAFILASLGLFIVGVFALWGFALYDRFHAEVFADSNQAVWLCLIVLCPVGGSIAYLSAKKNVQRYSQSDPTRIARLTEKESHA